jgi:hypothetical protein
LHRLCWIAHKKPVTKRTQPLYLILVEQQMPNASELLEQAARSRDSAMRAHRLAGTVNEADAIRLQGYRDQLLEEASDLERQAAELGTAGADAVKMVDQRQREQQPQHGRATTKRRNREG